MKNFKTKVLFLVIFLIVNAGVFAIGIDYVNVTDETCGNDGEINFQINDLAYGEEFEYSLDGGSSWSSMIHDVMYSGSGYSVYNLSMGNYYFRVREAGETSHVNYSGNPVVVSMEAVPAPEITGYYTGHGNTCLDNGSIIIYAVNAAQYSIDNGSNWQSSNSFSVPNGTYQERDILVRNSCGVTAQMGYEEVIVKSFEQIDVEGASVGISGDVEVDWDDPTCISCADGLLWNNAYPQSLDGMQWSFNGVDFESIDDYLSDVPFGIHYITFKSGTCEYLHPDPVYIGGNFVVNIPDPVFKALLVGDPAINTNSDAEIQYSEAWAYTGNIEVQNSNISDLTGIEAFVFLNGLNCQNNNLENIDVTANTELGFLNCNGNNLLTLDVNLNTSLYFLNAGSCGLTSIDLSQNQKLTYLTLSDNALESLDLSQNILLNDVYLSDNSLLELSFGGNAPNYADVINNPYLVCVQVGDPEFADNNWDFDPAVNFTTSTCLSSNAFLSDISISGMTVDGFYFDTFDYTIIYPYCGTYDANVTATLADANANLNIELPGASNNHVCTITVTAENGVSENIYTINFVSTDPIVISSVTANHPTCPGEYGGFTVSSSGGNGNLETGVFTNTNSGIWSWWYDGSYPIDNIGPDNYAIRVRDEDGCVELYNGGDSIALVDPVYTHDIGAYNNISATGANDGSFIANASFEGANNYMYQLQVWNATINDWDSQGAEQSSNVFENLAPGRYSYSFRALPMDCGIYINPDTEVFVVMTDPESYSVTFSVTDGTDPIVGANVTLDGNELTTDASGSVSFSDVNNGNYNYMVSADGFSSYSGSVNVDSADESVDVTLDIIPVNYSVTFNVTDGTEPIEGASITFGATTLLTNASGVIVIDDQPAADYNWSVSATGYVSQSGTVTISESDVTIDIELVEEAQFNNVTFVVSDGVNPIEGAIVTIGTYDFVTLSNGYVTSNALAAGTFDYTVTAEAYQVFQDQFTIVDQNITINVQLEPEPVETYSVTFNVTNGSEPIEGAIVTFNGTDYLTGVSGQLLVSDLNAGTYDYSVTATDFQTYESQIEIVNSDVLEDVELILVNISDSEMSQLEVFPNPARSKLYLHGLTETCFVEVFDLTGKPVLSLEMNENTVLEISHLAKGMYLLKVSKGDMFEVLRFEKQ